MEHIHLNHSLLKYNTFNIDVMAKYFFQFSDIKELQNLLVQKKYYDINKIAIGGGSNLLFTKDFEGLVVYANNKEINILSETSSSVLVSVGAGVKWDDFVSYAVKNDFSGIENLSLIPGNVGASPVQNIGAYGVEAGEFIHSVNALDLVSLEKTVISQKECNFAYRNSIFKNIAKNKYVIYEVVYKLNKQHKFKTSYGNISEELKKYELINLENIRKSIINIREQKMPDTKILGNAGSFFKNPIVTKEKAENLKQDFPNIVTFPFENEKVKIAAAWLIDSCLWKNKRIKNVGVYKNQALIIVNYGDAKGYEILNFSKKVIDSVYDKFGVTIEREVNIL